MEQWQVVFTENYSLPDCDTSTFLLLSLSLDTKEYVLHDYLLANMCHLNTFEPHFIKTYHPCGP